MQKEIAIQVSPEQASNEVLLMEALAASAGLSLADISAVRVVRRSIDARQRQIKINIKALLYIGEALHVDFPQLPDYNNVRSQPEVIIVGAGPAGLFAALRCIELGLRPVILERGKDVRERRRDLRAINLFHQVDPDSNYCFGEGGAGTYSDGKLYTRSDKRGDINRILRLLVAFGASPEILIEAHPHIGTNKLPGIISAIRELILSSGGIIHFSTRVTDILIERGAIAGVCTEGGETYRSQSLILATGHSARDIFNLLFQKNIAIEAKPFALGVRVEHPQHLIDKIQYKCENRGPYLPPAPYSLVKQVGGRGVYSFCMCPGGIIAPCATHTGEVVTNGWSPSKRDQPTANSGIVAEVRLEDLHSMGYGGPLGAMLFQKAIEERACKLAGSSQRVPAQRLTDFVENRLSASIPVTSYKPGTTSVKLSEVLPQFLYDCLQEGFINFGKSMRGFITEEAVVHAPESRTSSPVRIPRDPISLQHPQVAGLFPCGEGAGYAGGILSAAIDGEKCAEKLAHFLGISYGQEMQDR